MERYLSRSNAPAHLQPKIELALQIYRTSNRALLNKMEFQLELDACLRWCALLQEQLDSNVLVLFIYFLLIIGFLFYRDIEMILSNTSIKSIY